MITDERSRGIDRKDDRDGCTFPLAADQIEASSERFDGAPAEGQAETVAFAALAGREMELNERLHGLGHALRGHARAAVADLDDQPGFLGPRVESDRPADGREADRVVEQAAEGVLQATAVDDHGGQAVGNIDGNLEPLLLGDRFETAHSRRDDVGDGGRCGVNSRGARLESRQIHQVVDQTAQPDRVVVGDAEKAPLLLGEPFAQIGDEDFEVAEGEGQWAANGVRGRGEEVAPSGLHPGEALAQFFDLGPALGEGVPLRVLARRVCGIGRWSACYHRSIPGHPEEYTGCPVIVERGTAFAFDLRGFTTSIRSVETTEMSSPPTPQPRPGRFRRRLAAVAALATLVLTVSPTTFHGAEGEPESIDILFAPYGVIRWQRGGRPVLLVYPEGGDGWINLARRFAESAGDSSALRGANPDLRAPMRDRHVRVPVEILRDDLRLEAVRRIFPADRRVEAGWEHWVLDPFGGGEESWQWLAELFTGREESQGELKRANPERAAQGLQRGRTLVVPAQVLLAAFRSVPPIATAIPIATATAPVPPTRTAVPAGGGEAGPLAYGSDGRGGYAVYRLRKGEALYSAVVVRFTGQLLAKQVNETAMEIAARSGIEDVTDIPVGFPVKIPLDLLLPEYLPSDDPRRLAWVAEQRELGRFLEVVNATDLSGVQVILDAGHGGNDTGALVGGLWESAYAYDLMCRIKANLERHTRATVWTTIQQKGRGYSVPSVDRLDHRRDAYLLTRPPYTLEDSVLGVHLRWYLTNDIILNRLGASFPRSKTVFLSVHTDSLHPSVRGAMVYVPSRYLRPSKFTVDRRDIRKYAEYRNHPTIHLGTDFKARVEASSRHLADNIIESLSENEIGVHPYEPVRDRVLRGRSTFVPAVLRFTAAQNAVLLEACNMANPEDRALLQRAAWREQFARAVVEGMASAFKK